MPVGLYEKASSSGRSCSLIIARDVWASITNMIRRGKRGEEEEQERLDEKLVITRSRRENVPVSETSLTHLVFA